MPSVFPLSFVPRILGKIKDEDYSQLVLGQLELYQQRLNLVLQERDVRLLVYPPQNVKSLVASDNTGIEEEMERLLDELKVLKADRTKDQTSIFELERKLGFMQVHYTYDRAKLMNNAEVHILTTC